MVLGCATAQAQVDLVPSIEGSVAYSDNLQLNLGDAGREEGFVYAASPALALRIDKPRLDVDLNYRGDLLYAPDLDEVDYRNTATGRLSAVLVRNLLSFDATANVRPTFVGLGAGLSNSPFNFNDNRQLVQRYSFGPTLRRRFGRIQTTAAYRFNLVRSEGGPNPAEDPSVEPVGGFGLADSEGHVANASITQIQGASRFTWSINGSASIIERQGFGDFERYQGTASLFYSLTRRLRLNATGGYFVSSLNNLFNGGEGAIARGGFDFTSDRLQFGGQVGTQAGVINGQGRLRWVIGRTINISATYTDQVATGQDLFVGSVNLDPFGTVGQFLTGTTDPELFGPLLQGFQASFLNDGIGVPIDLFDLSFTQTSLDFRQQRLQLAAAFNRRDLRVSLSGFYGLQTFDGVGIDPATGFAVDTGSTQETAGVNLTVGWDISRRLSLTVSPSYRRFDFAGADRQDDLVGANLRLVYGADNGLQVGLRYNYDRRFSSTGTFDLEVNTVSVFARFSF